MNLRLYVSSNSRSPSNNKSARYKLLSSLPIRRLISPEAILKVLVFAILLFMILAKFCTTLSLYYGTGSKWMTYLEENCNFLYHYGVAAVYLPIVSIDFYFSK